MEMFDMISRRIHRGKIGELYVLFVSAFNFTRILICAVCAGKRYSGVRSRIQ